MEMKNFKLIVVLGMHRSGTSTITRGLQVMDVDLGDRLIAPIEGVNARGFWEDIDLVYFNIEILTAIGSDWHHVAPIENSDVEFLRKQGYFLRAVDLLRQKVSSAPIFGFKDPRVAKLLPFWKSVFSYCQFDLCYVISVRHPLSVARSLIKRDGIDAEKSYLLWLGHVVTSIWETVGERRVLVDYDRLMQSPVHEITRIAQGIDMHIDPIKLQYYKAEFLDPNLRHTVYDLKDLLLEDVCPPLVREIYTDLLDVASDQVKFDAVGLQNKVVGWVDEFERLKSPLSMIDRLFKQKETANQSLAERDGQIANLNQAVAERDGQIANLNQAVAERANDLTLSRIELSSVLESTCWKLTTPLRQLMVRGRQLLARLRVLQSRSVFVLRQEGVSGFMRRTGGVFMRYRQRKVATRQLDRFVVNAETGVSFQNAPLVSFVIPIYDRTEVLRTSIESALGQSLQIFEVILVTDGSPPATLAIVEEYRSDPRVRIFNYPVSSGNAVRGRNKGILEARGRYIAFLDSDDVASPDRIEVCLPILESNQADVVYGSWRAMLDGTRVIDGLVHGQEVHSPDCDLAMLEKICVPCQSTVMVRRALLLRTGFLKPRMKYREDHELWVRLAYHGANFKSVPHVLTDLRLHAGNNELNFKGNDSHWETLLKEEFRLTGPLPLKIVFLLAGLGISGGAAVVLKHVSMLMEEGHDAFVVDLGGHGDITWFGNPAIRVYRMEELTRCGVDNIDLLFATFWTTVEWLEKIPARRKLYLVQSDERLFYDADSLKAQISDTYRSSYEYVTIAPWLVSLLRKEFGQLAAYVPNGLDSGLFYPDEPVVPKHSQRLRVLIEGPISVPFKGVADAYAAVNELDCELWIVSTSGRPESNWRYDRFFEGVSQVEMRKIYSSCHILLKMSRVESFAYPPLEAMACGCTVVLGDVNGGIEYAHDGVNVLKVPQADVVAARAAVQKLLTDQKLRERLIQAGFETVKCWSWEPSKKAMLSLVGRDDQRTI